MTIPSTIICNKTYDTELMKIKNFQLHEELLPFVGSNYDLFKILLVGESHYIIDEEKYNFEMLKEKYKNWYGTSTEDNYHAYKNRHMFNTRGVIEKFQLRNRGGAFTMFSNPAKVIKDALGEKCPTDSAAFSFVSFFNYFQRPHLLQGRSFISLDKEEEKYTAKIFEEILDIIKPSKIIFLSKKAYNSYEENKMLNSSFNVEMVYHPTSIYWYKLNGKRKFKELIDELDLTNNLKDYLSDERVWLMKKLFNELENKALKKSYDTSLGPVEFIDNYYLMKRNSKRRPYLNIKNKNKEIRIEIDSKLYFYYEGKKWEYLSFDNNLTYIERREKTPNFRNVGGNKAFKDLFDLSCRTSFVDSSISYVSKFLE